MTKHALHPAFFRHLVRVQGTTAVGLCRASRAAGTPERTAYRWQAKLAGQLLIVPNVTVEALGLRHAHVFITKPRDDVVALPFAVESALVTPDFCEEVLYLHCLVPAHDQDMFAIVSRAWGTVVRVVWSSSGWQQFVHDEPITLPIATNAIVTDVLERAPLVVPTIMELWQYPNSLRHVWTRIVQRVGDDLRRYVPRKKILRHNGHAHLSEAFALLRHEGLVTQQLIRCHPLLAASVEVFVMVRLPRDELTLLLEGLRSSLHAVETYPTSHGYFCRLLGPARLLDAIMTLSQETRCACELVHFHLKRHPSPPVRFAYEALFNPVTKSWVKV